MQIKQRIFAATLAAASVGGLSATVVTTAATAAPAAATASAPAYLYHG